MSSRNTIDKFKVLAAKSQRVPGHFNSKPNSRPDTIESLKVASARNSSHFRTSVQDNVIKSYDLGEHKLATHQHSAEKVNHIVNHA